jgi:hypothetical protein
VLIQESILPAISEADAESVLWGERYRVWWGAGAKGLTCFAVAVFDKTARIRDMYRTVLGEGDAIGDEEAATRRRSLFVGVPGIGLPCQVSLKELGERA